MKTSLIPYAAAVLTILHMVPVSAWVPATKISVNPLCKAHCSSWTREASRGGRSRLQPLQALETKNAAAEAKQGKVEGDKNSAVETTEKFGLEAGLFESFKQKDGGESAKSLLKKYGIAYLATSIPLAIVSFAICYLLVDNGVDVAGLLGKIGIETNQASETAGTFAIAYAAHKAASPIRFPPTVILTPLVAKMIGKEPNTEAEEEGKP